MVLAYATLNYRDTMRFATLPNQFAKSQRNWFAENVVSVLDHPRKVVLNIKLGVTAGLVFDHYCSPRFYYTETEKILQFSARS